MPVLSIIIPALNTAETLGATVAACGKAGDIIIIDGGSTDDTPRIARALGCRVIEAQKGRGVQLAAGAAVAKSDWLLFLHADTVLHPDWLMEAQTFMDGRPQDCAAYFTFALDADAWQARVLERMVLWRNKVFALPYGDQGLLIGRAFYESLGGFAPLPLMEDVEFIRRIGAAQLFRLNARAITSAAKWRRDGWARRSLRNLSCLALYYAGVAPARIAALYR